MNFYNNIFYYLTKSIAILFLLGIHFIHRTTMSYITGLLLYTSFCSTCPKLLTCILKRTSPMMMWKDLSPSPDSVVALIGCVTLNKFLNFSEAVHLENEINNVCTTYFTRLLREEYVINYKVLSKYIVIYS